MQKIRQYGPAYLLWLFTAGLGIVDLLAAKLPIRIAAVALGANKWTLTAIQNYVLFFMAIGLIVFVYWIEHLYRQKAAAGIRQLLQFFSKVTAYQLGFLVLAYLAIWLIPL